MTDNITDNALTVKDDTEKETKEILVKQHGKTPHEIVEDAVQCAKELQKIVNSRDKKLILQGKQYLFFEDWQTLAKFDGITAKVVKTEEIVQGTRLLGFSARAVALKNGEEISAGEAECCYDEPNWRNKPRFQLKSMAQTRACAKALRNCLAFIAVLANYEPTPAEEMEGLISDNEKDVTPKPKQAEVKSIPDTPDAPMTPAQEKLIQKILKSRYLSEDERRGYTEDYQTGMSKGRATKFINWWLGDKEKGIIGERDKREKASSYSEKQKEIIGIAKEGGINSRNTLLGLLKEKKIIADKTTYEELMKLIDTNQDKYEQIKAFLSSWVLGNLSIEDKNE